ERLESCHLAVRSLEAATGEHVCAHRSHDRDQAARDRAISEPDSTAQLSRRLPGAGRLSQLVLPRLELCRGLLGLRPARDAQSKLGAALIQRLHWGCGPITPYGWVNSDIQPGPGVDVVADIRAGLPLPDDTFDYIPSIHTLPELSYAELDRALLELRRVLRPGGALRLSLPDFDKAIQA